jgi:predicted MPP superfamily phosphohydrolase
MIRRKVLVVDDELSGLPEHVQPKSPRDETYQALIEQLNLIAPQNYHYEPLFCGSEDQVRNELRSSDHSNGELISIVDLVLDQNNRFSEQGASDLLDDILLKSRQTFFTTRRLEQAKVSTLVKFQRANRSAGLFPYELLQQQPTEFAMLLHRGLDYHDEGQAVDYLEYLQKKGYNDINILMISDFHLSDSLSHDVEIDLENLFAKLSDTLDGRRIDLVFLVGDFTDKGRSGGFSTARAFIKKLSTLANLQDVPSDFIRLVPGNHDIVAPLALAANISRSSGEYKLDLSIEDGSLIKYCLQPFLDFRETCIKGVQYFGAEGSDEIGSVRHWLDARWTAFGFVMVGFDSNSFPTMSEQVVGQIEHGALLAFRKRLSEIPKERRQELTLLVLAHHYTGDGAGDRGILERDALRKHCSELGFKGVVFVNGDRHGDPSPQIGRQLANSGTMPLEIAVPTFCQKNVARQEDASRGAVLFTFVCAEGSIESARIQSYGFREGGALAELEAKDFALGRNGWGLS